MSMTRDDIAEVVRTVLEEERKEYAASQDEVVLKTVSAILTSFGLDDKDKKEIQADFVHLRKWRKSVDSVERVGVTTVVTVILGGLLGAVWLGIKTMLGK